ncbi:MAG: DNA translocase FtsK 4TM domain-containing protein, partial [bacterium]
MRSTPLKREILGIALLLFGVFLAGAFGSLALAQLRAGVSVEASVGLVGNKLARPLVTFFGWPAAVLIPLVPAVHALRLFGRLESDTDRSWMIFFAGMVVLLPIALALALPAPPPGVNSLAAGLWGGAIESWWIGWFGAFGAWVVIALAASVLMAATLAWNPIRALIGHRTPIVNVVQD